jgi:hypothetical protein
MITSAFSVEKKHEMALCAVFAISSSNCCILGGLIAIGNGSLLQVNVCSRMIETVTEDFDNAFFYYIVFGTSAKRQRIHL